MWFDLVQYSGSWEKKEVFVKGKHLTTTFCSPLAKQQSI